MTTARSRMRVLLATTSVTALMAAGSAPLKAACVVITGVSAGYTNPVATTIDCITANNATVTGNVVNNGAVTPGSPNGISVTGNSTINGTLINTGSISATVGAMAVANAPLFNGDITNSGTLTAAFGLSAQFVSLFAGDMANSGTISAVTAGIILNGNSTFAGGLSNSGSITANGTSGAIAVFNTSSFTGGIVNSGTLSSGGAGVSAFGALNFSGGIVNSGAINADSVGIVVDTTSTFSGGIANTGQITAGSSIGISIITVGTFSDGISNSGQIQAASRSGISINTVGLFAGGITNSGRITAGSQGIGLNSISVFSGGIVNSGTLVSEGYGFYISGVSTFLGGVVNSGTLNASYTAISLSGFSTFAGGIANSGTITSGSTAIEISSGTTFTGAIVNSGTITGVDGSIDASGAPNAMTINQTAGALNGRILLSPFADVLNVSGGAINGNILGQPLNTVNFDLGGGSFTYGPAYSITGVGQLNVNSGFVTLNGTNAAANVAVNGGTLAVGDSAHSTAMLTAATGLTVGPDGTLMGFGTVVGNVGIASGSTLSPGGSIGTMNVTGNLTIANGSFYNVEVNAAGAADRTIATGTAAIAGGTVQVVQQPGTYPSPIQYTILTANGGVNGTFTGATSELAFFTPELTYDAFNVYLSLSRNGTYFASVARTPNQRSVGRALDASPTDSALVQLLATQTAAGARQAYDALSGEVHASVQGVLLDDSRYMRHAMLGRLRQSAYAEGAEGGLAPLGFGGPVAYIPGGTTLSASAADFPVGAIPEDVPVYPSRLTFWSQAVGAWETIDGNGNAAEAQRDFGGLFAGMDAHVGQASRIGIVGGYTQSQLSVDERLSSADVDSGHVGVYASTSLDGFNLRAGAAYAFHNLETSRAIVFPGLFETAQADYDGDTGQVFGEIGYGIALGHIAAEPFAGLAWVDTGTDGFSETGGIAALDGAGSGTNATYSTLGIRVATIVMLDDGTALIPRASAAWQHVFGDLEGSAALGFQSTGTDFSITGVPIARNAALLEAGLDVLVGTNARLGIAYTGALAEDAQDHAVKGNLTWRF